MRESFHQQTTESLRLCGNSCLLAQWISAPCLLVLPPSMNSNLFVWNFLPERWCTSLTWSSRWYHQQSTHSSAELLWRRGRLAFDHSSELLWQHNSKQLSVQIMQHLCYTLSHSLLMTAGESDEARLMRQGCLSRLGGNGPPAGILGFLNCQRSGGGFSSNFGCMEAPCCGLICWWLELTATPGDH